LIFGFLIYFPEKKRQSLIPVSLKDSDLNFKYETLEKKMIKEAAEAKAMVTTALLPENPEPKT